MSFQSILLEFYRNVYLGIVDFLNECFERAKRGGGGGAHFPLCKFVPLQSLLVYFSPRHLLHLIYLKSTLINVKYIHIFIDSLILLIHHCFSVLVRPIGLKFGMYAFVFLWCRSSIRKDFFRKFN